MCAEKACTSLQCNNAIDSASLWSYKVLLHHSWMKHLRHASLVHLSAHCHNRTYNRRLFTILTAKLKDHPHAMYGETWQLADLSIVDSFITSGPFQISLPGEKSPELPTITKGHCIQDSCEARYWIRIRCMGPFWPDKHQAPGHRAASRC